MSQSKVKQQRRAERAARAAEIDGIRAANYWEALQGYALNCREGELQRLTGLCSPAIEKGLDEGLPKELAAAFYTAAGEIAWQQEEGGSVDYSAIRLLLHRIQTEYPEIWRAAYNY